MSQASRGTARERLISLAETVRRARDEAEQRSRMALDDQYDELDPVDDEEDGEGAERFEIELSIVRAALKSERQQLVEMRAQIEELQATLMSERRKVETLRAERDRWAERAELLALPLFQERAELMAEAKVEPQPGAVTQLRPRPQAMRA